ncbi:hypothetical protein MDAP_001144 [Mitosporidium daphniae]|uniref:Rer1 protein n=1 Tax=Mitosporidium daphniae TaxID=1485682 RepID=A0A098VUB6_9MICR|nr:Rer1 protein [Mitosporidium daphniae]KGG52394.1 Rer1 protein [Mitosporidium daphniae]|eukprot:XP_013238821.1 Rer1 protein [Mitosporidium daphniae]
MYGAPPHPHQQPHAPFQYGAPPQSDALHSSSFLIRPHIGSPLAPKPSTGLKVFLRRLYYRASAFIERSQPYYGPRWALSAILLTLFMARVIISQGWYVIAYGLWIYLLNAFLAFLSPKFDPSGELDNDADLSDQSGPALPTVSSFGMDQRTADTDDDEFRPFVRRLPEFTFWHSVTTAIILSICISFFSIFDIPVFWPILLVYFILLFAMTMKRQIKHMIKYKYIPFDLGKKKYNSSNKTSGTGPFSAFSLASSPQTAYQPPTKGSLTSPLSAAQMPHYVPPAPFVPRPSE